MPKSVFDSVDVKVDNTQLQKIMGDNEKIPRKKSRYGLDQ